MDRKEILLVTKIKASTSVDYAPQGSFHFLSGVLFPDNYGGKVPTVDRPAFPEVNRLLT